MCLCVHTYIHTYIHVCANHCLGLSTPWLLRDVLATGGSVGRVAATTPLALTMTARRSACVRFVRMRVRCVWCPPFPLSLLPLALSLSLPFVPTTHSQPTRVHPLPCQRCNTVRASRRGNGDDILCVKQLNNRHNAHMLTWGGCGAKQNRGSRVG